MFIELESRVDLGSSFISEAFSKFKAVEKSVCVVFKFTLLVDDCELVYELL